MLAGIAPHILVSLGFGRAGLQLLAVFRNSRGDTVTVTGLGPGPGPVGGQWSAKSMSQQGDQSPGFLGFRCWGLGSVVTVATFGAPWQVVSRPSCGGRVLA